MGSMDGDRPDHLIDWLRRPYNPNSVLDAAHPNSRFCVPANQCNVMDSEWESPEGVPISAIIFGGRRSTTVPLVYEARDWNHGVFMGATMTSETTAAAAGKRGVLRADPFAMRPFAGYNMADYFDHWLKFGNKFKSDDVKPRIFHVNWFRKSEQGKFLWPGFGDNIRVMDWIIKRCEAKSDELAVETPLGYTPTKDAINTSGLDIDDSTMEELLKIEPNEWQSEIDRTKMFFDTFGDKLPQEMNNQLNQMSENMQV